MDRESDEKAPRRGDQAGFSPPFTALRAVEAASRHRSFTSAARELSVTHSAVSQAIRRLEADLGTPLFARRGGAMEPSDAALRLARSYAEAAEALEAVIRDVAGGEPTGQLRLDARGAELARWLADRRARLADAFPDLRIEFGTAPGQPDAEFLVTDRPQPGDHVIGRLDLLPVCSPALALATCFKSAGDILDGARLEAGAGAWAAWSQHHGLSPAGPPPRVLAGDYDPVAAAVHGEGVALCDQFAAETPVLAGDLIALPFAAPVGGGAVLRLRPSLASSEAAERLVMGLRLEMARGSALIRAASRALAERMGRGLAAPG